MATTTNFRITVLMNIVYPVVLSILISIPTILCLCPKLRTESATYDIVVGILRSGEGPGSTPLQGPVQDEIRDFERSDEVKQCFQIFSVDMDIKGGLMIPENGWAEINNSIKDVISQQAESSSGGLSLVIGPFYSNIAMILDMNQIPYIVTDHKGYRWVDSTRVNDTVNWSTLVEIKPPAKEINLAVVDLFKAKNWTSAVVILPDNPKENQECQDLVKRMIENQISAIPYSLSLRSKANPRLQVINVLRNAQMLTQRIIITCSPRDDEDNLIQLVLEEAKAFNLLADQEYVLFILDTSMFLKPLREMNMYREGFYAARCQLLAYRYNHDEATQALESPYEATASVATKLMMQAQEQYLSMVADGSESGLSKSTFLKALRSVKMNDSLTGPLSFDEEGRRINYALQLYDHGGMGLYRLMGTWKPGGSSVSDRLRLSKPIKKESDHQRGIFDDTIKIVVVVEEPFVMRRSDRIHTATDNNDMYEGFTIDILKRLASMLKLQYEIVESPGNLYGAEIAEGVWDGMVGEVLSGNATLGMGAISITSAREKVVDFSLGVVSTGVNMLIHKPKAAYTIFQFMKPFSLHLWFAIVGASFAVSVIYFILDCSNETRQFTVKETLWFSIGTLLMRGTDFSPRSTSQRIMTAGFTFFVLITVSTYTANMAAFLTLKNLEQPIASLEDLADRPDIPCGTVKNSATMKFLQDSDKEHYQKIWQRINENLGENLVDNSTMGRKKAIAGTYAFIFDYLINSYSETIHCSTKMVGTPVRLQEHGIVMPAGSAFKSRINIALLNLKETNYIQNMKKKWWENKRRCNEDEGRNLSKVQFSISHMAGVFVVGALGMACSVAFFLFKKFYLLAGKDKEDVRKITSDMSDNRINERTRLK